MLTPPTEVHAVLPRIDSHTHVFRQDLTMVLGRRYTPDYDATLKDLFSHLDANGLEQAVLVQPSFLGTDNSYLLQAIAEAPRRLRGIAMVAPDVRDDQMEALARHGVAGVRFNLVGATLPNVTSTAWIALLRRIAALGWHIELHREARDLPLLIQSALNEGARVVVDHYGRPDPSLGMTDPALDALLAFAPSRRVWVKLSAAYRCAPDSMEFQKDAVSRFVGAFGADRLVWGSDWPHTQCEATAAAAASLKTLKASLDKPELDAVLASTPRELYGFSNPMSRPRTNPATIGGLPSKPAEIRALPADLADAVLSEPQTSSNRTTILQATALQSKESTLEIRPYLANDQAVGCYIARDSHMGRQLSTDLRILVSLARQSEEALLTLETGQPVDLGRLSTTMHRTRKAASDVEMGILANPRRAHRG